MVADTKRSKGSTPDMLLSKVSESSCLQSTRYPKILGIKEETLPFCKNTTADVPHSDILGFQIQTKTNQKGNNSTLYTPY